jgi:hypothetical protein
MANGKNGQNGKAAAELRAAASALRAAARTERRAQPKNQQQRKKQSNQLYTRPFRQGVGAITNKPFGTTGRGGGPRAWFNANHPAHLPLPRAIGPYTVIRTTQLVKTSSRVSLWGPIEQLFISGGFGEEKVWSNYCGVTDVLASNPINGTTNATFHQFDTMRTSSWNGCQLVPAAFTIQVMNPASVNGASGMVRIGRLRFVPDLQNDSRTWNELAEQMTSYNFPRLCSGGKLALRGVTVNAVPYDMTDLSHFSIRLFPPAAGAVTTTWGTNEHQAFRGFAPIMIIQEDTSAGLDVLVTCEWRVRFDPGNPAQGSHIHYPVSSDSTWGKALKEMEAAGHGVVDIAENVAEYGAAVKAAELLML